MMEIKNIPLMDIKNYIPLRFWFNKNISTCLQPSEQNNGQKRKSNDDEVSHNKKICYDNNMRMDNTDSPNKKICYNNMQMDESYDRYFPLFQCEKCGLFNFEGSYACCFCDEIFKKH